MTLRRLAVFALCLAACTTGGGNGTEFASIDLSATRLIGTYGLVDYLFEYGDGQRLDPSIVALTGTLHLTADSTYREGIRVSGSDSTTTRGRILKVLAENGNPEKGRLTLDLDQADSSAVGESGFAFRHDTLVLVTEVSKERDATHKGFRETAYWKRDSTLTQ
jgi:hypothetical protein